MGVTKAKKPSAGAGAKPKAPAKKRTEPSVEQLAARLNAAVEREDEDSDEELLSMFREALREVGGVQYLINCARDPRTSKTFLTALARLAGARSAQGNGVWAGNVYINTGIDRGPRT